jgi:hypothetical protein
MSRSVYDYFRILEVLWCLCSSLFLTEALHLFLWFVLVALQLISFTLPKRVGNARSR